MLDQPEAMQLTVFHGACTNHEANWKLTCEEMEDLRAFSGHACRLCRQYRGRLEVDHDHAVGPTAIRGSICKSCNTSYLSHVDSGRYPICDRSYEYLTNPWYLARRGERLPYDPRVSVSANGLSVLDRAELDRVYREGRFWPDAMHADWARQTRPHFDHSGIAACLAANDYRPLMRLLRMTYVWEQPNTDIAATGPGVPNGEAHLFLQGARPW